MVTLAGLRAVGSPLSWGTWLGAVGAGPAGQAIAGAVQGAAGGVVIALAGHTALAVAARRTGAPAGGASEARCTHTAAILRDAGAPILAGADVAAVDSPETLRAGQVATSAHPASLAQAVAIQGVATISMVTVTATGTSFAEFPLRAGQLAVGSMPPRSACTGSSLGATDSFMGTLAGSIATKAPGSRWAGHRAVTTLPTFLADTRAINGRAGDGIFTRAAR